MSKRRATRPSGQIEGRRVRAAEMRKAELAKQRRERLVVLAGVAVGVLVLVGVIVFAALGRGSSGPKRTAMGQVLPTAVPALPVTTQAPAVVVPDTSGIPGVVSYAAKVGGVAPQGALQNDHVLGAVTYSVRPPVGGQHNAKWMTCGVYTAPVPSERAVHDLEHGAVWITYRPSLPAASVAVLRALVLKQSMKTDASGSSWRYMDLTPWTTDALPAPVVISAWGHQLNVSSAADPRLQKFIDAFRDDPKVTPEFGSPCGGQAVNGGGTPEAS